MATTGAKIKKLREVRGYSQSYMATKLSVSQTQYSYLETKQKNIDETTIKKVTALLGVTVTYFENFEPDEIIQNETLLKEKLIMKDVINDNNTAEENYLEWFVKLRDELRELQKEIRELKTILKK